MTKTEFLTMAQDSKLFAIGRASSLGIAPGVVNLWLASL